MRYLVTGGYGFMGSFAALALARAGHEVCILSRSSANRSFVDGFSPQCIESDLACDSPSALAEKLPSGLDGCVHTASLNDVFIPNYAPKALAANVLGTRTLLEAICIKSSKERRTSLPLVLYPSTYHVYGRDCGDIDTSLPPSPRNEYALSHLLAEEYCRYFQRTEGLPSIILRPTNGYGTPCCLPFTKWHLIFHDLCMAAWKNSTLQTRTAMDVERDFVWMGDICQIIGKLLQRPDLSGEIFIVASQKSLTLGDFMQRVAQSASKALARPVSVTDNGLPHAHRPPLRVSSATLLSALDISFTDCIEEEVASTLALLSRMQHV